ncbi:uncharacterized protein MYCFIDRAFT_211537 [Pseudocercospora fijiensis CIRAD86]|uniref:Uncharacterized protein n=1 Tax=Pseudocercospora fijiensis (strain CIRAD86) TaxID=383855 RepID=M2ZSQ6_PSEFD|nr:uncharacterized protein MYCFIDRAFT_211537 [Pseudocercospora fijiensis CIRAD86]EME82049.1 hypothetical protein MYCFIDRAFT_211537 [Pseudocercospora fijiensis CIRAD86]
MRVVKQPHLHEFAIEKLLLGRIRLHVAQAFFYVQKFGFFNGIWTPMSSSQTIVFLGHLHLGGGGTGGFVEKGLYPNDAIFRAKAPCWRNPLSTWALFCID